MICLGFAAAIAISATIGGTREVISQLAAASLGKDSIITLVINFGFVLVGPAIFAAVVVLAPWSWWKREAEKSEAPGSTPRR